MKCQICTSPYRREIETMYLEGYSPREISVYIENTYGVKYSPQSIYNHCKNHLDPVELKTMVENIDTRITQAEKELKKLEEDKILQSIIEDAEQLRKHAKKMILNAEKPREVEVYTALWHRSTGRTLEIFKYIKDKQSTKSGEEVYEILKAMWEGKNS